MLDQNTDRMWYVIGAVIVGAAIIFLLNSTMPNIFASVGETFEAKTEDVTEVTDGIMPKGRPGKNELLDAANPKSSTDAYIDYPIDMDTFNALKGQTVTLSFDAKSETGEQQVLDAYFRVHNDVIKLENNVYELSDAFTINGEYQRFSHTMVVPDFTTQVEDPLSIRIRRNDASGSGYIHIADALANGHVSINNDSEYTIRHVKLELGTNETEYVPHETEE